MKTKREKRDVEEIVVILPKEVDLLASWETRLLLETNNLRIFRVIIK